MAEKYNGRFTAWNETIQGTVKLIRDLGNYESDVLIVMLKKLDIDTTKPIPAILQELSNKGYYFKNKVVAQDARIGTVELFQIMDIANKVVIEAKISTAYMREPDKVGCVKDYTIYDRR